MKFTKPVGRRLLHIPSWRLNKSKLVVPANRLSTDVELESDKKLKVVWRTGNEAGTKCTFHAVWLRHNCQCPDCVFSSGQKRAPLKASDPNISLTSVNSSGIELRYFLSASFNLSSVRVLKAMALSNM